MWGYFALERKEVKSMVQLACSLSSERTNKAVTQSRFPRPLPPLPPLLHHAPLHPLGHHHVLRGVETAWFPQAARIAAGAD